MLTMVLGLAIGASAPAMQSHTYAIDNGNFANPERGFWLSDRDLGQLRSAGMTMAHAYVRLDAFRDRPLSREFLEQLQARFDAARAAGVKLVPRFTYNFPKGLPLAPGDEDAPLPIVLAHIDQLTPVLRRNADVIAYLEAGFVGAWGEWHDSTSGLDQTWAEGTILQHLLRSLPRDRFVALRYERDKAIEEKIKARVEAANVYLQLVVEQIAEEHAY